MSEKVESGALSEREEQVLLYATRGLTDKEIARKLGISTATVLTYWMRIRNKLGGSNRAELVASAVRKDAQGEITAKQTENQLLLGEILRRMQAEENVRESEERFRTLFNGGSDWILVYHLDENNRPSKFIEVNDIACERLGYTREELTQMSVLDIVDRALVNPQAELDNLLKQQRIIIESIHVTKEGMRLPTEVSATLFTLGDKPTVQAVCRDLTSRKEAEHALKDAYEAMERRVKTRTSELEEQIHEREQAESNLLTSHSFAESLINSSLDGILAYDHDLRFTVWNPAMERIYGKAKEDVVGKNAIELFPFLKEIGEDKNMKKALQGKVVEAREREYTTESGEQGFFEGYYSPLVDREGTIIGGLGVIRDTTERKQIQEELARHTGGAELV